MNINTVSVGLIKFPITYIITTIKYDRLKYRTIINVSINMVEFSSSVGHTVLPVSLVLGTIWPHLDTITVSLSISHLTLVHCTIGENDLLLELKSWFIRE
jgi:hypothetical protein